MEYSTRQAVKYILTTYNDGKTNKLYDSTFRLRPPFKPNPNGNYKVTINECLFQNNELNVDKSKYTVRIISRDKNGNKIKKNYRYTVNQLRETNPTIPTKLELEFLSKNSKNSANANKDKFTIETSSAKAKSTGYILPI